MAQVAGVHARFNMHVKANERGNKVQPVVLFGPAGAAAGAEVADLADLMTRLQTLCEGKVASGSLNPKFGMGAVASYINARNDDWPESNPSRTAQVLVVDTSGSIVGNITIPFLKAAVTEQDIAAFLLADVASVAGRKLQCNSQVVSPIAQVRRVQFISTG